IEGGDEAVGVSGAAPRRRAPAPRVRTAGQAGPTSRRASCSGLLGLRPGWGSDCDLDLDLVAINADRITADLDARIVRPGAIGDAESPRVPGTGDDPILDVATAERGSHVGTHVVDGVELAILAEKGDQLVTNAHSLALAFGHVASPTDRMKVSHS